MNFQTIQFLSKFLQFRAYFIFTYCIMNVSYIGGVKDETYKNVL